MTKTRQKGSPKKTFVLDTNVVLYDPYCFKNFEDNDVIIPIVVLEEIDRFKNGTDSLNVRARTFIRELDAASGDKLFKNGLVVNDQGGKLFIKIGNEPAEEVFKAFGNVTTADNRILSLTLQLRKSRGCSVILVSKDINLRTKAKGLELKAEDYTTGRVDDVETVVGSSVHVVENAVGIDEFYEKDSIDVSRNADSVKPNEYYILRDGSKSALARVSGDTGKMEKLVTHKTVLGIKARNAEQSFVLDALLRPELPIVAITGKAGTGKSLLALAASLSQHSRYAHIFIARPIVPLSNKDIGYLPGNIAEKIEPYMQPLWDNLAVILSKCNDHERNTIQELRKQKRVVVEALAYIRGRSLDNICFVVDEAQNLSPHEMKTIVTRMGENSKLVFTGDIYQIDNPYLDANSCGLTKLAQAMRGQSLFAHVNLVKGERSQVAELASNLL